MLSGRFKLRPRDVLIGAAVAAALLTTEVQPAAAVPGGAMSSSLCNTDDVVLTGEAAEVSARGQWHDGYWTVEFRRARETPVKHIYDTIFNRLVQFSVHVFDQAEGLDQAAESRRLFLQFLPPERALAENR